MIDKHLGKKARAVHSWIPKEARQAKGKVKRMIIIVFDIKSIVRRELMLAGQTVDYAYYCDVLR
jgi:hypothetical protein